MIGVSVSDILKVLDQIPVWKTVSALPKRIAALEERIAALEGEIAARPAKAAGPACPLCGEPMKTTKVEKDRTFAFAGLQQHTLACVCGHTETRQVDPKKV